MLIADSAFRREPRLIPGLPAVFEAAAAAVAAECHDLVGSGNSPKHAGLFQSLANDRFAAGFDDTRTDKESLPLKLGIAHSFGVALEVVGFGS